jgi:hypothetical protein
LDDTAIEKVELLVIDLLEDPGGRYHVGSIPRHGVLIFDNDAYWNGVLARQGTEQHFRLRLLEAGNDSEATIVSSLNAEDAGGARGVGAFPVGEWPVTVTRGEDSFEAVSDPIPFSTSLMFKADLLRHLTLRATPPEDPEDPEVPYHIDEKLIIGTYTDSIAAADPDKAFLGRELEGALILMKDLPAMEEITIPVETPEDNP